MYQRIITNYVAKKQKEMQLKKGAHKDVKIIEFGPK